MKIYKTIQGDTWDMISYKVYGNGMYMDRLIKANRQYMNIYEFSAGVILTIPESSVESSDNTSVPWRK